MKQIVAGSAWFKKEVGKTHLNPTVLYCLKLSGKTRPKICYISTALGDSSESIEAFYDACSARVVEASHLQLFPQPNHDDIESYLSSQDVIWVEGGSVVNLLAVWRAHELDTILHKAWENDVILGGVSAGSICWNVGGTTDSFGPNLQAVTDGLAFLPYSNGVHYDSDIQRRPLFHKLIEDGTLPSGYATDDGVALHFVGTKLHKAVSELPKKHAYYVYKDANGKVVEDIIKPHLL